MSKLTHSKVKVFVVFSYDEHSKDWNFPLFEGKIN